MKGTRVGCCEQCFTLNHQLLSELITVALGVVAGTGVATQLLAAIKSINHHWNDEWKTMTRMSTLVTLMTIEQKHN